VKVIIVGDLSLRDGPSIRILNMLPYLSKLCEIKFVVLGPLNNDFQKVFHKLGIHSYSVQYTEWGWFIRHRRKTLRNIIKVIDKETPDIVVLSREIWDLMAGLSPVLMKKRIPFAVVVHSVPFVDAPPKPSNLRADVFRKLILEDNFLVKLHLLVRLPQLTNVLRGINIIVINETVDYYLSTYFTDLTLIPAIPGYAINKAETAIATRSVKTFDLAYMCRLEYGKGLFEIPKILEHIRKMKKDIKILVIGEFAELLEKRKFLRQLAIRKMSPNIKFAGWVDGNKKYSLLREAKVFLYPSLTSDTFSISLLEALACGLPAICYDVPFARIIYRTPAVQRVPYRRPKEIALLALKLLSDEEKLSQLSCEAKRFSLKYSSWEKVAEVEYQAYRKICERNGLPSDRDSKTRR